MVSGFKIKSFVSPHGLMMIIDDCLEMTLLCLHYDVTDLTHSFSGISDPSAWVLLIPAGTHVTCCVFCDHVTRQTCGLQKL